MINAIYFIYLLYLIHQSMKINPTPAAAAVPINIILHLCLAQNAFLLAWLAYIILNLPTSFLIYLHHSSSTYIILHLPTSPTIYLPNPLHTLDCISSEIVYVFWVFLTNISTLASLSIIFSIFSFIPACTFSRCLFKTAFVSWSLLLLKNNYISPYIQTAA